MDAPLTASLEQEDRARFTLAAGVYAGRITIAFAVFILALTNLTPSAEILGQLGTGWSMVREIGIGLLILLVPLTVVNVGKGVLGYLRHREVPPTQNIAWGAVLDVIWVVWGYMASGYSGLPFPPLLVLMIGVYGVLLSMRLTAVITSIACILFVLAHSFGEATQPVFGAEAQAALFVGIGLVSAIVGNRIRAASMTVQQLSGALQQLNRYHQQVMEYLPAGVVVAIQGENQIEGNTRAQKLLGGPVEEILDQKLPRLTHTIQETLQTQQEGILAQQEESFDNGQQRWVAWTIAAHEIPDIKKLEHSILLPEDTSAWTETSTSPQPQTRRAVIAVLGETTDQRQAEQMKAQADKLRAIAELSAGLAHEIRNPTAALRLSAQQLAQRPQAEPEDTDLTNIIIREANRLSDLVQEFLDFARVGEGEPSQTELEQLVREALEVAQAPGEEQGAQPELVADIAHQPLRVDGRLVHRALSNLLLNAFQFTPADKKVKLEARARRDAEDIKVEIRVRDQGPGIEPERRDKIFSPFYTTRSEGSGLGLAIAARAASLLGGDIIVEDPTDDQPGSVFIFTFRAEALPASSPPSPQNTSSQP